MRRRARGKVFGPVGVEEVGSTRYLDMGEIDFPESGVSDGWPCDFFLESGVSVSCAPSRPPQEERSTDPWSLDLLRPFVHEQYCHHVVV